MGSTSSSGLADRNTPPSGTPGGGFFAIGTVRETEGLDWQLRSLVHDCRGLELQTMTPRSWYYAKLAAFSAFPFLPVLVPVSYYAGVPWLTPAFAFIGIPVLDLLMGDRKSTRLNSSHRCISYAVFCLKKKKTT